MKEIASAMDKVLIKQRRDMKLAYKDTLKPFDAVTTDKSRVTVGKLATDAMQKELVTTDAREQGKEMTKTYMDSLVEACKSGKVALDGDFYLVVLTKKEKLLQNVIRNYFLYRRTCPTPDYDQAVYKYNKADDAIDFLWVIPARDITIEIKANALDLAPELHELRSFVLDFADGTLDKKAKMLNGEDKLEGKVILEEIHEQPI